MEFELAKLDGALLVSLADALDDRDHTVDWDGETDAAIRSAIAKERLDSHSGLVASRGRSEPEIWYEWVGSALTSEGAVKGAGWLSRNARKVALVAFFAGFLGFGASTETSQFIEDAQAQEMVMVLAIGDQELDAVAQAPGNAEPAEADLASDQVTESQLRDSMRSNLARSLVRGISTGRRGAALSGLQTAGLRGLGARERLVSNAVRPAAPKLEGNYGKSARIAADFPDGGGVGSDIDEIFDRRIKQLKGRPSVWRRLRASAAKPAKLDLLSRQFLSATLSDNSFTRSHAFRSAAERSTAKFVANVAETGDIPRNMDNFIPTQLNPNHFSGADKARVGAFEKSAPDRVGRRLAAAKSGKFRVGSLFRALPSSNGSRLTRASKGGRYATAFPDGNGRSGFARGIFGRSPPSIGRSGGGRGFRFRLRRKGITLGAQQNGDAAELPLESFEWVKSGSRIEFILTPKGQDPVRVGSYDAGLVNMALAFAADGRPDLASLPQMVFEQDDRILSYMNSITSRIVVHPAIRDTTMACDAVNVDRFVDVFMRADLTGSGTDDIFEAWKANVDLSFLSDPELDQSTIKSFAKKCGIGNECFPVDTYSAARMDLSGYRDYLMCLDEDAGECQPYVGTDTGGFTMTSTVREQPYKLDSEFGFLTGRSSSSPLWPFKFAMGAVPLSMTGEELALGDDFNLWDFPAMEEPVAQMVADSMLAYTPTHNSFRRLRDFTVLQRLFKTALDGQFGGEFPFDSLVELQQATSDNITIKATGNWDLYPIYSGQAGFSEFMNGEAREISELLGQLSEGESTLECKVFANSLRAQQLVRPLPNGVGLWSDVGKISNACQPPETRNQPASTTDEPVVISTASTGPISEIENRLRRLREHDLIEDAIMLGKGGYSQDFMSCAAG